MATPLKSLSLRPPKAPNLPIAPVQYDQRYIDQLCNVLRLYFNQIDNFAQPLTLPTGGAYLTFPYGSFYDDTSQYDGSTIIPYAMRLNKTSVSNGVTVESRDVTATGAVSLTTMTITSVLSGRFYPSMLLSSTGAGTNMTSGTYVYLQLTSTAAVVATPTWVSGGAVGDTTVVLSSVTGIEARQFVSGTGVPVNTRVVYVDTSTNTVTLSAAFTVQASGIYSFRPWGYEGTYSVSPSQTVTSRTIIGTMKSKITVQYAGIYNLQFSAQFTNTENNQIHDFDVWFKKNDVTIANSDSQYSIVGKHSGANGHMIAALNFMVDMDAGDYVEIIWSTSSSNVFIEAIGEQTSPLRPADPSVIATMQFVSALP